MRVFTGDTEITRDGKSNLKFPKDIKKDQIEFIVSLPEKKVYYFSRQIRFLVCVDSPHYNFEVYEKTKKLIK